MAARAWMCIVWPAFLVAAVLELLVFAVVDPGELQGIGQRAGMAGLSALGVYTLSFFVFWLAATASSTLTVWLASTPAQAVALEGCNGGNGKASSGNPAD